LSKSGKIVATRGGSAHSTAQPVGYPRSLSSSLDQGDDPYASTYTLPPPLPDRGVLPLPDDLSAVMTLDGLLGEDDASSDGGSQRKSIFDMIGEGISTLLGGAAPASPSGKPAEPDPPEVSEGSKGKRDTPANLPKLNAQAAHGGTGKNLVTMAGFAEDDEEAEFDEEDEDGLGEISSQSEDGRPAPGAAAAGDAAAPKPVTAKGKRDTPASLPTLPGKTARPGPALAGFAEEEEEEFEESARAASERDELGELPERTEDSDVLSGRSGKAAAEPVALPIGGWLLKQSGGKHKSSVGNALAKWDKRWFVIASA
jgi:hypothetical protein